MAPQDRNWDIYVLEYARARDQPVADLVNGAFAQGRMDTPFSFVLIRNQKRVALIDCGFMREGSGAAMSDKLGFPTGYRRFDCWKPSTWRPTRSPISY